MQTERRELPAERPRAAPDEEQLSAVTDVLEHLLDPLEDVLPGQGVAPFDEAASAGPWLILEPYERRGRIREFVARLRWSERNCFRIPRFLARWAFVTAAFWGVVWLIFSSGMAR
jgi:hypothetical protein